MKKVNVRGFIYRTSEMLANNQEQLFAKMDDGSIMMSGIRPKSNYFEIPGKPDVWHDVEELPKSEWNEDGKYDELLYCGTYIITI